MKMIQYFIVFRWFNFYENKIEVQAVPLLRGNYLSSYDEEQKVELDMNGTEFGCAIELGFFKLKNFPGMEAKVSEWIDNSPYIARAERHGWITATIEHKSVSFKDDDSIIKDRYIKLRNNTHNLKLGGIFKSKDERDEAVFQTYLLKHGLLPEDLSIDHIYNLSGICIIQKSLKKAGLELSSSRLSQIIRKKMRIAIKTYEAK
jgi:hypothetical protein